MEAPQREDVEAWKQSRWSKLPTWAQWTIGVVGVVTLLVIGAFIGGSEEDDLKAELAEAQTELTAAEGARDDARAVTDRILDNRDEMIQQAQSKAHQIVGTARSEGSELSDKLESLQGEVDAAKSELAETESSLAGAEREEALSSFGNGIWQAEVDFIPGTYRAPGGSGCYWAALNSADPSDIATNELTGSAAQQIATIETPFFQSEDCGTWERVE